MLDGNPCARVDDYREKILRWDAVRPRGSSLRELDGDIIFDAQRVDVRGENAQNEKIEPKNSTANARLFRSDFLNANPILLEYLAKGAVQDPLGQSSRDQHRPLSSEITSKSRFARRLRAAKSSADTTIGGRAC